MKDKSKSDKVNSCNEDHNGAGGIVHNGNKCPLCLTLQALKQINNLKKEIKELRNLIKLGR
jgi:hypothetical protein